MDVKKAYVLQRQANARHVFVSAKRGRIAEVPIGQANEVRYEIDQLLEDQYRYQQQLWGLRQQIQSGRLNDRERRKAGYYRQQLRRNLDDISSRIYYYQSRLSERQTAADTYAELLELEYSDDSF